MTLLPHPNQSVRGVKLGAKVAPIRVGPKCANPDCTRWADHAHHIWRRSFLAGDFAWVELWDGTVIGNLTGLCFACHDDITVNRARIVLESGPGDWVFHWVDPNGVFRGPLRPQPPRPESAPSPDTEDLNGAMQLTTDGREVAHTHVVDGEEVVCPTCKRRKNPARKKSDLPPGEKRKRARYVVMVPKDSQEDGFEVLETLVASAAEVIGRETQPAYFTLVEALAFFLQHSHLLHREEVAQ